jgi:hypothetical protein
MSNEPHAYGLRSGTQPTTRMPGNATSGNLVMSPEQFERLLASLKTGSGPTLPTTSGRFAGARGESVAAFIDAVTIYKDCVGVSDLNALKGLAMLLDGAAATWWQGTKATVDTWETAINALRRSFGEVKPNYKIFRELFSRQQKDTEATDMFVNSARALLSKLSPTPPLHEIHQIDMIYGLLSSKIRRLVPRDELNNFETFIAKTRGAEDALKEEETQRSKKEPRPARSVHTVEPMDTQRRSVGSSRGVRKPPQHVKRPRREQIQGKFVLAVANWDTCARSARTNANGGTRPPPRY